MKPDIIITAKGHAATMATLQSEFTSHLLSDAPDRNAFLKQHAPAVRGLATFVSAYSLAYVGTRLVMNLRREMFERLLMQPMAFFDDSKRGRLVATAAYNVIQVTESATSVVTALVRETAPHLLVEAAAARPRRRFWPPTTWVRP